MKTLFLFVASLFFTVRSLAQWTWLNPKPSGYINKRIVFADRETGFVLNTNGDLFKTTNRGDSWQFIENFPASTYLDIHDSTGIIDCNNGLIFLSVDNGNHWQLINTNINDGFETVNIVSRDTIFLSNSAGNIYKSTDRAKTWTTLHCNIAIRSIVFVNSMVGYAGGPEGDIVKTNDGGVTWQLKRSVNFFPSAITSLQFLNSNTGYAFEEYDSILMTTNGGDTWTGSNVSSGQTINTIDFLNSTDGYLGGENGALYATHNGGKTFSWAGFDGLRDGNEINSLYFLTKDTGFAVGFLGRIIKTTNAGINWLAYDSSTYLPITAISFATPATAYSASWNNLYKTTDSGNTWHTLSLTVGTQYASQSRFSHCHFFKSDTGLVVSTYPATIHYTNDGGNNWQTINPGGIYGYDYAKDLQFINDTTGFISLYSSDASAIFKTKDKGITWQKIWAPVSSNQSLIKVFYTNEDTGYAIAYGLIEKTTDGSKTWDTIFIENDFPYLTSISFVTPKTGFVTGDQGQVLKTSDSGRTWQYLSNMPYVTDIEKLKFYSEKIGFFTAGNEFGPTDYGALYETIDSGSSWQLRKDLTGTSIEFTQDTSIIIAGFGGTILKSKIIKADIDSLGVYSTSNNCGYYIAADIYTPLNYADSVSFEVTTQDGTTFLLPANTTILRQGELSATADFDSVQKGRIYTIRVKYFYNGSYHFSDHISFICPGLFNTWTGAVSTAWEDPRNWSCGYIPNANTDVIINFATHFPVINSNAYCGSIYVEYGTIKISTGFNLTITEK